MFVHSHFCWHSAGLLLFYVFGVKQAEIATHFKLIVMPKIEAKSEDKGNKNVNVVNCLLRFIFLVSAP